MPKHTSEVVEAPYLRTVVSRFGGVVAQGNTVSIPTTAFEIAGHGLHQPVDHTNFNQRYGPSVTTYGPGVAGYGGFKPHGTTTGNLEAHSYLSGMHEPQKQPYVMPPPGYAGHLRNANAGDATRDSLADDLRRSCPAKPNALLRFLVPAPRRVLGDKR